MMTVRFWGVRGSVPAPLTPTQVEDKVIRAMFEAAGEGEIPEVVLGGYDDFKRHLQARLPFSTRSTYGGNTTCVEVRCDGDLIILDMGTGLRELGLGLMKETFDNKGLRGTILQSHVHWDHIQGYPFWPQLYMPRTLVKNEFTFHGGLDWNKSLEEVLRGQMNPPMFPVEHREIEQTAMRMHFNTVYDGKEIRIPHSHKLLEIKVLCRKLNHPQETYGYRIEYDGQVVTFCTDHEPFGGGRPHRPLIELAKNADIFISDCQYTHEEYVGGVDKLQKLGWGHSFPGYVAQVAQHAGVKRVVTAHHDPQASDRHIEEIAEAVVEHSGIKTEAAWEGLVIECG